MLCLQVLLLVSLTAAKCRLVNIYFKSLQVKVDLIIGEPYFQSSILPWDVLRWWFIVQKFQDVEKVIPVAVTLWALPIQFKHLHKIRAPLNYVNGFAMFDFDQLIQVKHHSI